MCARVYVPAPAHVCYLTDLLMGKLKPGHLVGKHCSLPCWHFPCDVRATRPRSVYRYLRSFPYGSSLYCLPRPGAWTNKTTARAYCCLRSLVALRTDNVHVVHPGVRHVPVHGPI